MSLKGCVLALIALAAISSAGIALSRATPIVVALAFRGDDADPGLARELVQNVLLAFDFLNTIPSRVRYVPLVLEGLHPEEELRAARDLGAVAIVGAATSSYARTLLPIAQALGIPLISPTSVAPSLAQSGDVLFRAVGSQKGSSLGMFARNQGMKGYIAVLNGTNRIFSDSLLIQFAQDTGITPRQVFFLNHTPTTAELDIMAQAMAPGDDLLVADQDFHTGVVIQQLGFRIPNLRVWVDGWGFTRRTAQWAGRFGNGARAFLAFDPEIDRGNHPFFQFLRERYATIPDPAELTPAFDAVAMVHDAVRSGARSAETVRTFLENMPTIEGLGHSFRINVQGDALLPLLFCRMDLGFWRKIGASEDFVP